MTFVPDPAVWRQGRAADKWYRISNGAGPYFIKVCESCGTEALIKRKGRFCSSRCMGQAWQSDNPTYRNVHERVRRARGKASEYGCVDDCGRQAEDWSQIHGTDGTDPEHYEPRCRTCHVAYDGRLGAGNGNAKLSAAQRLAVQLSVGATQQELADHFGVTDSCISKIRRKESGQ